MNRSCLLLDWLRRAIPSLLDQSTGAAAHPAALISNKKALAIMVVVFVSQGMCFPLIIIVVNHNTQHTSCKGRNTALCLKLKGMYYQNDMTAL